jgi:phosphoribosylglycinamide formyltransferase 1
MKNIAIFASGEGTNAQNIIDYFKFSDKIKVKVIVSNNPHANVLNRAKKEGIPAMLINRESFYNNNNAVEQLRELQIDAIILAGFLWLLPENLIDAFHGKIINIHPALLPKYGGKGMYGMKVHEAVIREKEKESGISIHYVNNEYDKGEIISQHKCVVDASDTPQTLANKIHELEKEFFPKAIEKVI